MSATILLWQKQMKKALVHPEEIVGMLVQPILWVILFGVGMRSLMGVTTPDSGNDYMTFVVPGIVALTAVSAAIAGGSTWLSERLIGIIKEYLFILDENEGIEKAYDIRDWPGYKPEKAPDVNIRAAIFYGDIIGGSNPRVTWEEQ